MENDKVSRATMTIPPMEIDPITILSVRYLDLTNELEALKKAFVSELNKINTVFSHQMTAIEALYMAGGNCLSNGQDACAAPTSAVSGELMLKKEKISRPKKADVVKPSTIDTTSVDDGDVEEEILL